MKCQDLYFQIKSDYFSEKNRLNKPSFFNKQDKSISPQSQRKSGIESTSNNGEMIRSRSSTRSDELMADEKKIKEEIVLIGEKSDIESLLDNENNQLYNLIMANSMRAGKLNAIEDELGEKRYAKVRQSLTTRKSGDESNEDQSQSEEDDDYEIEIEINERVKQPVVVPYEVELKRLAKYLVDEITKISLNKVR